MNLSTYFQAQSKVLQSAYGLASYRKLDLLSTESAPFEEVTPAGVVVRGVRTTRTYGVKNCSDVETHITTRVASLKLGETIVTLRDEDGDRSPEVQIGDVRVRISWDYGGTEESIYLPGHEEIVQ